MTRPNCGTYGMCLPLLLNSATLPLGKGERFPLMVPLYVIAVTNDPVFSLQAARQRRWQKLRVLPGAARRVGSFPPGAIRRHLVADATAVASPSATRFASEAFVKGCCHA